MRVIRAFDVNGALLQGLTLLHDYGYETDSRNGPVVKVDQPVSTVTTHPTQRVLFHPWRDANPFFHFYESLWMLAGRQDIKPLTRYVSRMADYSDDGVKQNAAYGYRWRHARSYIQPMRSDRDQLDEIIKELKDNPKSRQCVLQIWDHELDLGTKTKDHACNIAVTFQIDQFGALEMVVFCRSNDAIWGCHGANAVHFSVLMEYVARSLGVLIGSMTQVSVNYHAYKNVLDKMLEKRKFPFGKDDYVSPYNANRVEPYPLMQSNKESWDVDVKNFVTSDGKLPEHNTFWDKFFLDVAWPIVRAHDIYKDYNDVGVAIAAVGDCKATDWRLACIEWLERRRK